MKRVLCGLLSIFLGIHMLSFARVVKESKPTKTRDGDRVTLSSRTVDRVKLTLPAPPATGKLYTLPVAWVLVPLAYGVWCIVLGERELWRRNKGQDSEQPPRTDD